MKLYFSVGDTGVHGLQSSDKEGPRLEEQQHRLPGRHDSGAATLDGQENLQADSRTTSATEYEPCVDSFGNVFRQRQRRRTATSRTRICHVLARRQLRVSSARPRPDALARGSSPAWCRKILRTYLRLADGHVRLRRQGCCRRKYWGQPLHTDRPGARATCGAYHLTAQGRELRREGAEDVVESTDNWFPPLRRVRLPQMAACSSRDWYDPGVGGARHGWT